MNAGYHEKEKELTRAHKQLVKATSRAGQLAKASYKLSDVSSMSRQQLEAVYRYHAKVQSVQERAVEAAKVHAHEMSFFCIDKFLEEQKLLSNTARCNEETVVSHAPSQLHHVAA
jgi:hypothetical protein